MLLSSHLLAEVEAVADQLVIIGGGRIAAQGSREELLAGTGTLVRAARRGGARGRAGGRGPRPPAAVDGGFVVDAQPEAVGRAALDGRVVLTHLGPSEGAGLEQLFFDLTTAGAPSHERRRTDRRRPPTGRDARPGLGRLTLVELRKMTDTRAGFWLQLAIAALTRRRRRRDRDLAATRGPARSRACSARRSSRRASSAPVVGVLLVSSEWSQRTAQITFGLVPRRARVMAAKLLAGPRRGARVAFALAVAAVGGRAAVAGADGAWDVAAALRVPGRGYVVIAMLGGIAFGAALLASAPAIVLYFVLPIGWAIARLALVPRGRRALAGRLAHADADDRRGARAATEWARVATTARAVGARCRC